MGDRFRMSGKFKESSSTNLNLGQTLGDSQMIQNFLRKQSENPQRKRNAEEICDKSSKVFTGDESYNSSNDRNDGLDDDESNSDINVALSRSLSQVHKITK